MIYLDIETQAIEFGKPLLPEPVGVAVIYGDSSAIVKQWYFSLCADVPEADNMLVTPDYALRLVNWELMRSLLLTIWASDQDICTHNGATFDIPILQHYFGLPKIDPLRVHDTLFLAYLHNPHARSLSLKDLANDWCGMPPDEQDTLNDWILANTDCKSRKKAGAYIAQAPAELVAPYAIGDVVRTKRLFEYLFPSVLATMLPAYHRELRLAPILADIQVKGVRVAGGIHNDTMLARQHLNELDHAVREALRAPDLAVDSNDSVVAALKERGYTEFLLTPTGKPSTSGDSLDKALSADPELRQLLERRATYATMVGTFMEPWSEMAQQNEGRIHASYNQVRNPAGYGTRTGRLSSSHPNLQNVPGFKGEEYPNMRSYLLPEEGHVWVTGDFKSQEPRIAAHFEDGAMRQAYIHDPDMDIYMFIVKQVGGSITRKQAKVIFLGLLYGMGAALLAEQLGITPEEALTLRNLIKAALPDIIQLDYDCKRRFQLKLPIKTLGGRYYHCELPANGRSFEYKALNVLVQGSASDQTKEAIIYINDWLIEGERILGTVHDEISVSCTIDRVEAIKALMQRAANVLPIDVPMMMSFGFGDSWSDAK